MGNYSKSTKQGLEFEKTEDDIIDAYCKEKGIEWFAFAWDTEAQRFLQQYDIKYNKVASAMLTNNALVAAFEADVNNFEVCKNELRNFTNVELYPYGLFDKEEKRKFKMTQTECSKFSDDGNVELQTKTLDKVMKDKRVSFIKMDVEGYEEKCLLGVRSNISKQFPILAVSVYHKREDIWKLPQMI